MTAPIYDELKYARRTELIANAVRQLALLDDPQRLIETAVLKLNEDFGYEHVAVLMKEGDSLGVRAACGAFVHLPEDQRRIEVSVGITGWVGKTGRTYLANDTSADEHYRHLPGTHTRSELAVPIVIGGEVAGVLDVESEQLEAFDLADVKTLEALADLLAVSLQSSHNLARIRRQKRLAESLQRVGAAVAASLDLPSVLDKITLETSEAFDVDGVVVWLVEGDQLSAVATHGPATAPLLHMRFPLSDGDFISARAARERRPVLIRNLEAVREGSHPLRRLTHARSLLALPIYRAEQIIGALTLVDSRTPDRFDDNDVAAAGLLSAQLAVAIYNARNFEDVQRRAKYLELLNEITREALESTDLMQMLQTLANRLGSLIGADGCYLTLWDDARQRAIPVASFGFDTGVYSSITLEPGDLTMTESVLRAGRVLFANDVHNSPYISPRVAALFPAQSILGMPLIAGGQKVGAALLAFNSPHDFTPQEVALGEQAAGQIALAVAQIRLIDAESRRAAQMALLYEISRQVAGTLDEVEILQRIVDAMVAKLGYAESAIAIPVGKDELELVANAMAENMGVVIGFRQKMGQGVIGRAAETRTPYLTNDVMRDPYYFSPIGRKTGSALGLPLLRDDRLLGVLYIESVKAYAFDRSDVQALETMANHVAAVLENARLYVRARDRLSAMQAIQSVSQVVASSLELDEIIAIVVRVLHQNFGYDYVTIYLLDGDVLRLGGQIGYPPEMIFREISTAAGITGRTVRTRRTQFVADVTADPDFLRASYNVSSEICIPLLTDQTVLGVLNVESGPERPLTTNDVDLLTTFAGQVTVAVKNARLYEAERDHRELAEALREASLSLTSSLDFDTVLDRLLDQIVRVVPYDAACVMMVNEDTGRIHVARLRGYEPFGEQAVQVAQGLSLEIMTTANLRAMYESGRPLIIPDTETYPGWIADPAWDFVKSWAGAPVPVDGRVVAFFSLNKVQPGFYKAVHAERLAAFTGQASLAMQNARLFEAEKRQRRLAETLHDIARILNSTLDLSQILDRLLGELANLVVYDSSCVMLLEGGQFRVAAGRGFPNPEVVNKLRIAAADDTLFEQVQRTRRPVVLADAQADPRFRSWGGTSYVRSWIGVPLITRDKIVGTLTVDNRQAGVYTERDAEIVFAFASQAAMAIENAQLYENVVGRAQMLQALHDTSLDITVPNNLPELLRKIVVRAARLLGAPAGELFLCEADKQIVRCVVSYNTSRNYEGLTFKFGEGAAGTTAQTGEPLVINDYRSWPNRLGTAPVGQLPAALINAPMVWQGRIIGVINVLNYSPGSPFTASDVELLTLFAGQAAVAVENARLLEETARRADVQRVLYDAVRDFSAGLAEIDVLRAVARHMRSALPASAVSISRLDVGKDSLMTLLNYEGHDYFSSAGGSSNTHPLADYPSARWVIVERAPLYVRGDNPQTDAAERRLLEKFGLSSVLLVPLISKDSVFGLIEIAQKPGDRELREGDIELAQNLAAQAAVALENAHLHSTVQRNASELDALLKANAALLATLELEPLLQNVLSAAMAAIPAAEKGAVLLADPETQKLQMRAIAGYTDPRVRVFSFAGEEGYSAMALREQRPLLVPDARADPDIRYDGDIGEVRQIQSAIVAPLMPIEVNQQPLGVISLDSTRRQAFSEAELRMLTAFANTAAIAIHHARLHAEVKTLAITDQLTGLANRRAFDRALEIEFARAARYSHPLTLIVIDIDSFKIYNDTYGHPAGDERLRAIGKLLSSSVRDPDLAARYGGEEFALVLPHTNKTGAITLAERVCAAAAAMAPGGAPPRGTPAPGYTLSMGVATFPDDAQTAHDLLLAADNAELAAKRQGKNRVQAASGAPPEKQP